MSTVTPQWKKVQEIGQARGLTAVFTEVLLWNAPRKTQTSIFTKMLAGGEGISWDISVVAELQGAAVLEIHDPAENTTQVHRAVDKELQKLFPERILRFRGKRTDSWYWPKSVSSGALSYERIETPSEAIPQFLAQRLTGLAFSRTEVSRGISSIAVRDKVRGNIESTKITKAFFKQFQTEHERLTAAISGLPQNECSSYASILLNRLMFLYFLQKKEFLNSDPQYLQTCLQKVQALEGEFGFYNFYRDYLLELFFKKLNSRDDEIANPEIAEIVGSVPYINGGIFGESSSESTHEIQIPDSAFESIFSFFGAFSWHLDTRPTGTPDEINPEVIGYIFEQYINFTTGGKKENGAYYTKHDVTGFMVNQTLVPRILDDLTLSNPYIFSKLAENPKRYMFEDQLHGSGTAENALDWLETPVILEECWRGSPENWGRLDEAGADLDIQLPGETWVETFYRRERVAGVYSQLAQGDVVKVNDLLTLNLNSQLLLLDTIDELEEVADVEDLWDKVSGLSIIDPTCGSGAFLFAALEVLEDVYGHLHDRIRDLQATDSRVFQLANGHPNRRYFLRKHAAIRNLYGTDLMEDAIETAKLRIFLALASCLERVSEMEPLPDLDFNFKCGNLVVGFFDGADQDETWADIFTREKIRDLAPLIATYELAVVSFREASALSSESNFEVKDELKALENKLRGLADKAFFEAKMIQEDDQDLWIETNRPFHWFLEFPSVMARGGFDVVVGNPPYINKSNFSKKELALYSQYRSWNFPDFYAVCYERSLQIMDNLGRHAFVVMLSLAFADGYEPLRKLISERGMSEWWSTYGAWPVGLFPGVRVRNTILVLGPGNEKFTTSHKISNSETMNWVFRNVDYYPCQRPSGAAPVRGGVLQKSLEALLALPELAGAKSEKAVFVRGTAAYWYPVFFKRPSVSDKDFNQLPIEDSNVKTIQLLETENELDVAAALCGKLAYAVWSSLGDDLNLSTKSAMPLRQLTQRARPVDQSLTAADLEKSVRGAYFASLNAGNYYIGIRWNKLRAITDEYELSLLARADFLHAWRPLNIWYRQTMRATRENLNSEPVPEWAIEKMFASDK